MRASTPEPGNRFVSFVHARVRCLSYHFGAKIVLDVVCVFVRGECLGNVLRHRFYYRFPWDSVCVCVLEGELQKENYTPGCQVSGNAWRSSKRGRD